MNLSGILVVVQQQWLGAVIAELERLPGVEVYQVDAATGRIVVVQEADGVQAEADGLERIQKLPHVVLAQLIYHYFADDPSIAQPGDGNAEFTTVPAVLND